MPQAPFLIDAAQLVEFQACRRRYLLSRQWRPNRWRPKLLMDACLRQGILDLGNGMPAKEAMMAATTRLMATGANPGLDIAGSDPYVIALDSCAVLETVLLTLSKQPILKLVPMTSKKLGEGLEWVFLAHMDENGELHRHITVDRYDEDRLAQELHSWYVFGDLCMSRKPMHLHFIEIGQMRDGRRHSPWARAYQHDVIANRIKFQRKGGKSLQGDSWKSVYLADSNKYDAEFWVSAMQQEGVADGLIHHADVTVPTQEHISECRRHIKTEANQMEQWIAQVVNPRIVPMARAACDSPLPCSYQAFCFAPSPEVDIAGLGLYKPRK